MMELGIYLDGIDVTSTFQFSIVFVWNKSTLIFVRKIPRHLYSVHREWELYDHCFTLGNSHLAKIAFFELLLIQCEALFRVSIHNWNCVVRACEVYTNKHVFLIVAEGLLKVRLVHPAISLVSLTILADQSSVSGSQQSHKLDSRYLAGERATLAQILVGLNHIDDVISTLEWRITDGIFWIMRTVLCEDHT